MVVFVVGEVNRAPAHTTTAVQNGFMNMMSIEPLSAKRRNQRRVNVEHSILEVVRNVNQAQESREGHQVDTGFPAEFEDAIAERFNGIERFSGNDFAAKTGSARPFDTAAVLAAGNHECHFGSEPSGFDLRQEILQCRPAT